jgi:mannose-6-phosphate isomerase-like protein (cupin superfamily)
VDRSFGVTGAMSRTKTLPANFDILAPDGSEVRILLATQNGSMAHFRLPPGTVSRPVRHRTVEELWYVLSGTGQMWRSDLGTAALAAGTCLTIPPGTAFQFRAGEIEPLDVVAVTIPPWPGHAEADPADGPWTPTAEPAA